MVVFTRRRLTLISRLAIVGGIFLFLFVLGYYTGYLRENCGDDVACFTSRAKDCKPTDVIITQDNNIYTYSVRSSITTCTIHVTLSRVEAGAPVEFQALEGSKMICTIPKEELSTFSLDNFSSFMQYCHGILKEGLYEIIIKRVYSNVVGQITDIMAQAREALPS